MIPLTRQAHDWLSGHLQPGDVAIDATVGNGHDTLFLAQKVGPSGRVYGFDIQATALQLSRDKLLTAGCRHVSLLLRSHAELRDAIPQCHQGDIAAVVFNLGYLPGGGKSIITQAHSTARALQQACELLKPAGVLCVMAYPAHPGGAEETSVVEACFQALQGHRWPVSTRFSTGTGPTLFLAQKPNIP